MHRLVKYCAIAIGVQVVLTALLALVGRSFGLLLVIDFYYPVIFCIIKAGGFTGESTMMFPVFIGIPLGIIIYALIIGFVFRALRKT
jgi:hypothetical protein